MSETDEGGRVHGLAVAAALTLLSVSVGVDLQQLLAADTPEQLRSGQSKIAPAPGSQQPKFDSAQKKVDLNQQKLPSQQSKGMPRPVDPIR